MYLGLHDLQKRERKSSFSPFTHKLEPVHFSGMCNNIEEYVGAFCDIIRNRSQKSFSHTCTLVILSSPHISVCVAHQRAVVSCTAYLHTKRKSRQIQLTHYTLTIALASCLSSVTMTWYSVNLQFKWALTDRISSRVVGGGGSPPICSASPSEILNINSFIDTIHYTNNWLHVFPTEKNFRWGRYGKLLVINNYLWAHLNWRLTEYHHKLLVIVTLWKDMKQGQLLV